MGLQETRYRPYVQCSLAKHWCKHICKTAKAHAKAKFCKRASSSPFLGKLFFKISFPSKIFKPANSQPTHKDKNTNCTMTANPLSELTFLQHSGQERQLVTRVWQKWRFSAPQTHLWLIKVWFSASTFVVKIATFAKPETVSYKPV